MTQPMMLGAQPVDDGTRFRVWAPATRRLDVILFDGEGPSAAYPLAPEANGYFGGHVAGVRPGARYMYRLDGGDPRPDPAARFQPDGVHGPSHVVDPAAYRWSDASWRGVPLDATVIYELHVGTVTPEGTFDALIGQLDAIHAVGTTAIELMPVADFPGTRNWGYDGVCLFAPARAYGNPDALRRLVDAAHTRGLAVILDVFSLEPHLAAAGTFSGFSGPDLFQAAVTAFKDLLREQRIEWS